MDKIVLKPCSGEIQGYMDGDRMIWMVEDDWKESAGRNIDSSNELVKTPLPEDKDTTMSNEHAVQRGQVLGPVCLLSLE